ncbi:hypothetical protein D3C81_1922100 [compost metagenome]
MSDAIAATFESEIHCSSFSSLPSRPAQISCSVCASGSRFFSSKASPNSVWNRTISPRSISIRSLSRIRIRSS